MGIVEEYTPLKKSIKILQKHTIMIKNVYPLKKKLLSVILVGFCNFMWQTFIPRKIVPVKEILSKKKKKFNAATFLHAPGDEKQVSNLEWPTVNEFIFNILSQ